jgi:hypothetical protein
VEDLILEQTRRRIKERKQIGSSINSQELLGLCQRKQIGSWRRVDTSSTRRREQRLPEKDLVNWRQGIADEITL